MEKRKEVWAVAQFINNDGSIEVFSNYLVSNLGRMKSLNYRNSKEPKILKLCKRVRSNGVYWTVNLCKDGILKNLCVHRLVMSSFEPKGYFRSAVVDHIDSNPSNNKLSNLRWVTTKENNSTKHCKEAQKNHPAKSKRVKITFLDDGHREVFPSASEVYRTLSITQATISVYILNRNGYYKKLNVLFEYV